MTSLPRPADPHTTEQAAEALFVPASVIRKWKTRGQVMPVDYLPERVRGDGRRPLYLLDELKPRADAYHARTCPKVVDGRLVARCACGTIRQVPLTTVTNGERCANCSATTGAGLMQGPDRTAIVRLLTTPTDPLDTNNVV